MTAIPRRSFLGLLGAAAALCTGCQASTMAYFLFPEAKHEAEMKKLASEDGKEIKVAILTYTTDLETRPELIQADRQLGEMLARKLRDLCEANKENVTIVNPHKVEEFKLTHPNWQQEPNLADVGRQFQADYLIYIEISKLSMYESGSQQSLYHGQAALSVQVVDVHQADDSPLPKQISFTYPDARGPMSVDEMPAAQFRQKFLGYLAWRLARNWTAVPIRETYYEDTDD
ncbi:MAG TPA: hypothetical protein VMS17_12585 [Gemmataceae bacterium]|nr:hypothetical protein [Gemmataceae bacterium]